MGIFSDKKKREAFFEQIEEELIANELSKPALKVSDTPNSPTVLTPDEVSQDFKENNNGDNTDSNFKSPLDALKERMKASHTEKPVSEQEHDKPIRYVPKPKEPEDMQMQIDIDSAVEKSLLQKCKPYTLDEKGHDVAQDISPIYELQSVAEILRSENEKRIENLSKKYNIFFNDDNESGNQEEEKQQTAEELPQVPDESQNVIPEVFEETEPEQETAKSHRHSSKTAAFVKMVSESLSRKSYRFEETVDTIEESKENASHTDLKENEENLLFISDIDGEETDYQETKDDSIAVDNCPTETIKFTPVKDAVSNTQTIQISSMTQPLDIKNELAHTKTGEDKLSKDVIADNDFEEFSVKEEYVSSEQTKHFIKATFIKKRNAFIQTVLSGLTLFITALFLIPTLNDLTLESPKSVSVVFTVLLSLSFIVNFDSVFALKNIFNRKASADIMAVLAYVSTMLVCINSVLNEKSAFESVFLCNFVLFARALSQFLKNSYVYSNLRQITNKNPKKAVALLNDEATTFAMANHSIDGDILVAASKPADFIDDYFKYCDYSELLYGKVGIISLITAFLSVIIWFGAYKFFDSSYYAFFFSSSICCLAALPTVFFIDTLPLFSASKGLNRFPKRIGKRNNILKT
ncbi:MAG: hypothetical protein MJ091_03615, partial [Clostridia bacterium]|nr:hypothetical protein [Clostridia bacterium]